MSDQWIIVRNWGLFQHADVLRSKDTIPAWVKVYTKLLHNPDFDSLTPLQRGVLLTIWLEFASGDGQLSVRMLSRASRERVRTETLETLVQAGFIGLVASRPPKQSASLEKRREENPPTPLPGKTANPNGRQRQTRPSEVPAMIDAVEACHLFIIGQGWDESFTEPMVIEEFGRIERARRTTGTVGSRELADLLEQWRTERQTRYPAKAET